MTYGSLDEKLREFGLSLHLSAKGKKWTAVLKNDRVRVEGCGLGAEGAISDAFYKLGHRGKHR